MNCFRFNQLSKSQKINYVYNHCRLLDFEVMRNHCQEYGVCLYYNASIFVEISFEGMRGDQIRSIEVYEDVCRLSHWYEQVDISTLSSQQI